MKLIRICLSVAVAVLVARWPVAVAQSAGAEPITEVVVTTRRKEELLQEIPLAVSAIGADAIQAAGVRQLEDVVELSSSLTINESFSQNDVRISVRGLTNTRGRSNVAYLVDGVDVTSETTGTNAGSPLLVNQRLLNDLERIEVVRGPQSALYGRSAFAGAISYVTKDPGAEPAWNGTLDLAEDGAREFAAAVSGPVTDWLGAGVNGVVWSADGHYQNAVSAEDMGGGRGSGASGALVFEPSDNFKVRARMSWSEDEYEIRPVVIIDPDVTLPVPQEAIDAGVTSTTEADLVSRISRVGGRQPYASEDPLTGGEYPGNSLEILRGTIGATWDIGSYVLSSYTGITRADLEQRYELDRQADGRPDQFLANGEVDTTGETDQFSQDLRVASEWDLPVQLTLGGLVWQEDRDDYSRNIAAACIVIPACAQAGYDSWQAIYADAFAAIGDYRNPTIADTDHWSVYAMLEWAITDSLRLTVEDRYSDEDFTATIYIGQTCANLVGFSVPNGSGGCDPGSEYTDTVNTKWHAPKVTLDWRINDDLLLYASAARGVKPGGISLLTVPLPFIIPRSTFLYEPEKLWAYEIGAKTTWDGDFGTLVLNGATFYNDYSDKQTNTTTAFPPLPIPVPQVTNASSAHVLGVEIEAEWQTPITGLRLNLGYTWLDTAFDDFLDPTRSSTRMAIAGDCTKIADVGVLPHCFVDLSGNELEAAPEHTIVAGIGYARPLGESGTSLTFDATTRYQSEQYTSQDNFTQLDAWWQTDLRVGLERDNLRLIFYVDNVFDDDHFHTFGGNPDFGPGIIGNPGAVGSFTTTSVLPDPRIFGARLALRY